MKLELVARDHVVGLLLRKLFHDILTPNLNINMNVSLTNFSFDDGLRKLLRPPVPCGPSNGLRLLVRW